MAFDQAFKPFFSHCFRACAEAFLDTILPFLFFISVSFVMPLIVFCFFPEKTRFLAPLPLAMELTSCPFMAFMAFMAPAFFIPDFFMAAAFIAAFFMGSAMPVTLRVGGKELERRRKPDGRTGGLGNG